MNAPLILARPSGSAFNTLIEVPPQTAVVNCGPSGTAHTVTINLAGGARARVTITTVGVGVLTGQAQGQGKDRQLIAGYEEEARRRQTPHGQAEDSAARARALSDRKRALRLV